MTLNAVSVVYVHSVNFHALSRIAEDNDVIT